MDELKISLSSTPGQHKVNVVTFPKLDGGLNLWELDYRLDANQSPEMKNLWWQDGVLQCRDGQEYLVSGTTLGKGYAAFSELFWGNAFFHIGTKIYYGDPTASTVTLTELCSGVPENRGTFFRYNDWLLYKNKGAFLKIVYTAGATPVFSAVSVPDIAYVPIIVMNANPATGSGDSYQPENRLSPKKKVQYNAVSGTTVYHLPVTSVDSVTGVTVDGVSKTAGTDYSVDLAAGTVTFVVAPPVTTPATNNTVEITYSKSNADAYNAIMDCPYGIVDGGNANVCVLLGGCPAQPNAFFWNSNDNLSMNLSYWPVSYYNLAGDTEDTITGFGKQYSTLVVFKGHSVGKTEYGVETVNGRDSISFTYTQINDKTGCDLPWSIQLVENNLVFCNTYQGVHVVKSSSPAFENNVDCISRNVNGTEDRPGLLHDVRNSGDVVCSFDDDNRYWLCANGHVYLWDYLLSANSNPSWFYLDRIAGIAYLKNEQVVYHLDSSGRVTRFIRSFMDYGAAIDKVYQFPVQFFDTYDRLKDVLYVLFSVRSDTDTEITVTYQSDYETRDDLTNIRSATWRLSPRNLAYRCLAIQNFAHVAKRKPGCRHVRHFSMRMENNIIAQDLSVVSAQIYFRYLGRDR